MRWFHNKWNVYGLKFAAKNSHRPIDVCPPNLKKEQNAISSSEGFGRIPLFCKVFDKRRYTM